ncbi:T9SS type A sorting domain-containing protein [uncultured Draconibacterium sp.]|uniref:T9SS type A sorting domain-containing protein n=1 Tax=uncultured Draconibacterium sp. TaxID=1573823 RepID=UPI0029C89ADE|nr:T9SS type A sorting domain-containing protein [uncultured Draconibacterium sp.]
MKHSDISILTLVFVFILVSNVTAQNPQDGWSFTYDGDNFSDDALLDLRFLNEDFAGENGFIGLAADSNSFVYENGEPVRFWAINGGALARDFSNTQMERYARFLAKMGVNMIRFHGSINPKGNTNINEVDKQEADAIWKMVAAMKKEGIYSTISPFWAHNGHMGKDIPGEWGIDGYSGSDDLWAVMFFNETLKEAYKKWVEYLYTETNPYTGVALKDEPAVGLIQVKNEDGLFFWTIQNIKPELKTRIKKKFYSWLIDKYGSINEAQNQWGNVQLSEDNVTTGEMDIYIIWEATQEQSGAKQKRLSDQMQFMAETQYEFYKEMADFYRSLGCKQLINGNNWKTANAARLLDTERWTNTACDVIALNRYYDPVHVGPNAGWRIDPGHHYQGKSVLFQPNKFPVNVKQPNGHPVIITESGWNLPHKYQAEGPFLISAYMSLTGVDAFYWFNPSSENYDMNPYYTWTTLEGNQHPLSRWTNSIPGQIGMFPANALLYRKGYLSMSNTMLAEERSLNALWERKIPAITEDMGFDPNRDTYNTSTEETTFSALTYLTGTVSVTYGAENEKLTTYENLDNLIDFEVKKVSSSTGQLEWDYNKGICKMDAPKAQGVCGFIESEEIRLSDVVIFSTNEYATVNLVAMDDKKLSESDKILVQTGTVYQPTNWSETATQFESDNNMVDGVKILNTGKMPWKAANTEVSIKLKNHRIDRAILLNSSGYKVGQIDVVSNSDQVEITFPENTMYAVLQSSTTSSGIFPQNDKSMEVYPNPSKGLFKVQFKPGNSGPINIKVLNLLGQKVWERQNLSGHSCEIDIRTQTNGVYFAQISCGTKVLATKKICINNQY